MFQTHNDFLEYCIEEIKDKQLLYVIDKNCSTHTDLYLYKDKHLIDIINSVIANIAKRSVAISYFYIRKKYLQMQKLIINELRLKV